MHIANSDKTYISVNQQQEIISALSASTKDAPWREVLFFKHGPKISCGCLVASGFVFWQSGFRGYGLSKYGRGRIATFLLSLMISANQGFFHKVFVQGSLKEYYRPESMWTYGTKSAFWHQISLLISCSSVLGLTFFFAQRNGILPVPEGIHRKGVRSVALKTLVGRVRPYYKRMAMTSIATTAIMFVVGVYEYRQSCELLAKQNRKTLSLKED